jgi:hypothetical protein
MCLLNALQVDYEVSTSKRNNNNNKTNQILKQKPKQCNFDHLDNSI